MPMWCITIMVLCNLVTVIQLGIIIYFLISGIRRFLCIVILLSGPDLSVISVSIHNNEINVHLLIADGNAVKIQ